MKKLAMLLALCLLASMLPAATFADEAEEYVWEELPGEAEGFTGAEGLYAEPEGDAPDGDVEGDAPEWDIVPQESEESLEALIPPEDALDAPADEFEQIAEAQPHVDENGPQLAANQIALGVGESFELAGKLPAGKTGAIAYASTNASIASVDSAGKVTAVAVGDVTVTATLEDGAYAECFVSVRKAPDAVKFAVSTYAVGKGETAVAPKVILGDGSDSYAGSYKLTSSKPKVLTVNASGALVGMKTGKAVLTVTTYNGKTARLNVTVVKPPKKVTAEVDKPLMGVGETGQAGYTLPKKTASRVTYASDDPAVVAVDAATGEMKAVAEGTTKIRVTTFNGKTDAVAVTVKPAPVTLTFPSSEFVMGIGMATASAAVLNEGAGAGITYTIGNTRIARYEKGVIKALAIGETKLTASTYNGLTATCKLVVKAKPAYVRLPYKTLSIAVGDVVQLTPDVGNSASTFTYTSSAPKRVSVTSDGLLKGLSKGKATITIRTYNKKKCKLKVLVVDKPPEPTDPDTELPVDLSAVTLTIPARTTDIAGIPENLKKIDALRVSAIGRIDAMQAANIITQADAAKRKAIVNNAFGDYAFPWMTPAYQPYWKAANSENGAKDFKPGIVYYGLPYISGAGNNRLYNAERALKEARYTASGEGYYLLNQKNLLNKKYCGNDCSGYVDAAIWGYGRTTDRTTEIASSGKYRTIEDYGFLRTGDLICKANAHVVMFLYWASADKSKMMIIENGGIEPGTNTVHCIVMDTAYYQVKGYSVRRLATLG